MKDHTRSRLEAAYDICPELREVVEAAPATLQYMALAQFDAEESGLKTAACLASHDLERLSLALAKLDKIK